MKAKEYAERIKQSGLTQDTVGRVALDFLKEVHEIGEKRRVQKNGALFSILDEQELKWQAMCRLVPDVHTDGFRAWLRIGSRGTYDAWTAHRAKVGRPLPELRGIVD